MQTPRGFFDSLIFINTGTMIYREPNNDPIFHATHVIEDPDVGNYYTRWDRKHSMLGCVDLNKWRIPSISSNWYDLNLQDSNGKDFNWEWLKKVHPRTRGGMRLLIESLATSTMAQNIEHRESEGLAASKLFQGGSSLPLAKDQWKVEVRQLFETTLARIQINVQNVVRGGPLKYGGADRRDEWCGGYCSIGELPWEQQRKELCDQTHLFKSQGWQNVHVAASAWILSVAALVLTLAIPSDDDRLLVEEIGPRLRDFWMFLRHKANTCHRLCNTWAWTARIWISYYVRKLKKQI